MNEAQRIMAREMSQERDVQNLLWALKELGVTFMPEHKQFHVVMGANYEMHGDPVRAAQARQGYLRALEIQNTVTFPTLVEEFVTDVEENLLPALKSSNVPQWKKEFKEELAQYIFETRKVNAK